MNIRQILSKSISIRLTDDGDGFVSTARYGPLFGRSETWITPPSDETFRWLVADEASASEE